MSGVEKYTTKISNLLVIIVAVTSLITIVLWWLLSYITILSEEASVALAAIGGLIIGWGLASYLLPRFTQTLIDVIQAMNHVGNKASSQSAPTTNDEFTKSIISQVYQIASLSKNLTSDIEVRRAYLDAALSLLPISVLFFNHNQELEFANNHTLEMLKQNYDQIKKLPLNKVLDWVFHTDDPYQTWLEQARAHKIRDDMFRERVSIILADGERLMGDVIAHYEKDETHGIESIVLFIDKTKEYIVDEAQLDFVAVAAHELRGPITVIRGYLSVFEQEMINSLNVEQRLILQKMVVSAEMLSLYVNNILNVARVDQSAMTLNIRKCNWPEIITDSYEDLNLRAKAHGRILKLNLPKNIPEVAVDRVSIVEVINNLVDNAIKYSKEGGEIIISVVTHESLVETTVQDFGIGIPEMVVGNLFKKFYRSHRTKTGVSGTGLGLYLSKAIIDAHGGNIWVRSKPGEGAIFGFDLPTFESVADTLEKGDKNGEMIKHTSNGWIKNHSMYRR